MRHFARAGSRLATRAGLAAGLAAGLGLAAGSACRRTAADPSHAAAGTAAGDSAAADLAAATRGRELFLLLDQMTTYQGAHRGHPARTVAELGLDSLGPTVVRRIVPDAGAPGAPGALVAFRRPEGGTVRSCRATAQVLEDASLGSGRFTIHCTLADGTERPFTVAPAAPPASRR